MSEAGPFPKQGASMPFYKALGISALLHLGLLMLVQPARWSGPSEVVIQARMVPEQRVTKVAELDAPLLPGPALKSPAVVQPPVPLPAASAAQAMAALPDTAVDPPSYREPVRQTTTTAAAERDEAPALPQLEVPLLVDTRWYSAREVERRPEPLGEIMPVYPEEARRRGIEGSVMVALHIDETGAVREVEVLESTPPGVFEAAVIAAYGQARFQPAVRAGRAVRYLGKYRVEFALQ